MPSAPINPTQMTPPRVAFLDAQTGMVSREWYRFLLSLLTATQDNQTGVELAPDAASLLSTYDAALSDAVQALGVAPSADTAAGAGLQDSIQALELTPPPLDILALRALAAASSVPAVKTADFTVAADETWLINNKTGSACTVTLPAAAVFAGRSLTFQNYQSQVLVSASANVTPQGGGAAGTAILDGVAGNWAALVSDGTNWVIMQAASFNNLLH